MLPRGHFIDLANHVICGDQVIVRGEDMVTVTSLLMVLKVRLAVLYTDYTYVDKLFDICDWQCPVTFGISSDIQYKLCS